MTAEELERRRSRTYRRLPELKITGEEAALEFIEECGFLLLFPVRGVELPDLWQASTHHEEAWPWGCWQWKETLPGGRKCAYGKMLRRKGTFISWGYFPSFMALYASPHSYLEDYRAGRLNRVEREILETLEDRGPLLTRELRRALGLKGRAGTREFHRALENLQMGFRITVAGGELSGWSMHRWELIDNWVPPEVLKEGWKLQRDEARQKLLLRYLRTAVAARVKDIARLFSWEEERVIALVEELSAQGLVEEGVKIEGLEGEWVLPAPGR